MQRNEADDDIQNVARATGQAVVLGDVIRSRRRVGWAQHELSEALAEVAGHLPEGQRPAITIGDEFQGVYPSLGVALHVILLCQLILWERGLDSRYGVAWGRVPRWSLGREPYGQDGPAWWAAREALEALSAEKRQHRRPPQARSMIRILEPIALEDPAQLLGYEPPPPGQLSLPGITRVGLGGRFQLSIEPMLQALVLARDTVIDGWDSRDRRLYLGLEAQASLSTVAQHLGISVAAASVRSRRNGIYAVLHMEHYLRRAFEGDGSTDG